MSNAIEDIIMISRRLDLADANEAETRLKVIDKILFDVLKWELDDVTVEERVSEDGSTTYSDYVVRTASTAFIIEAKKIGIPFATQQYDRRLKLTNNALIGPFGDAIVQARDYCRKLSIQFAVVTNGVQWIIFPANRTDQVMTPTY